MSIRIVVFEDLDGLKGYIKGPGGMWEASVTYTKPAYPGKTQAVKDLLKELSTTLPEYVVEGDKKRHH